MKPRKGTEDVGSLDSLLDTMTNVVGILIIIMVMTQLNISQKVDAMRDAQRQRIITEEDIANLRTAEEEARSQLASESDPLAEQARLEVKLAALKAKSEELEALVLAPVDTNSVEEKIEAEKQRQIELVGQLKSLSIESERLEIELANTDAPEVLAPFQVRMPFPRPPPEGAKEQVIICAYNRVYTMDLPKFYAFIQSGIFKSRRQFALPNQKVEDPLEIIYDPLKIEAAFKKKPVVWDQYSFTVRAIPTHTSVQLLMDPVEERGETMAQIKNKRSRFLTKLSEVIKEEDYVRFFVRGDSFEVYQLARRACDNYNIPTGWVQMGNSPYSRWLPKIKAKKLKEPPPPDPNRPVRKTNKNLLD